jgi:hypothetical protein
MEAYPKPYLITDTTSTTSTVETPDQQIKITTPSDSNKGDISHEVLKIFSDNGQLGFIFLCIFLAAYLLDIPGFLKDVRSGFKNVEKLANGVADLASDLEKFQRRSEVNSETMQHSMNLNSETMQHSMNLFVSKIEANGNKVDTVSNKIDELLIRIKE